MLLCYVTDRRSLSAFESAEQQELRSVESLERREILSFESAGEREMLLRKIEDASDAGVDWIQIREKDLSAKDCATLTREALQRVARSSPGAVAEAAAAAKFSSNRSMPARILVNDRLDVAISENAGGVHLSEKSLPVAEAKRLADSQAGSRDFLIGVFLNRGFLIRHNISLPVRRTNAIRFRGTHVCDGALPRAAGRSPATTRSSPTFTGCGETSYVSTG